MQMPSFSQLHLKLKMFYEPDYLNHVQEIIIQLLEENRAIFMREHSHIDFATGNVFIFNFSFRPPPCLESFQPKNDNIKCVRSMMQTTRKIGSWPRRVDL